MGRGEPEGVRGPFLRRGFLSGVGDRSGDLLAAFSSRLGLRGLRFWEVGEPVGVRGPFFCERGDSVGVWGPLLRGEPGGVRGPFCAKDLALGGVGGIDASGFHFDLGGLCSCSEPAFSSSCLLVASGSWDGGGVVTS